MEGEGHLPSGGQNERERERERERETETDRQTDRQKDRGKERIGVPTEETWTVRGRA